MRIKVDEDKQKQGTSLKTNLGPCTLTAPHASQAVEAHTWKQIGGEQQHEWRYGGEL